MRSPSLRTLAMAVATLVAAFAVPLGCTVDSVAPEGCREIEYARCEAAPACPNLRVTDVAACKRYYRDQCLHGMTTTEDPGTPNVDKCVQKIKACTASGPDAACQGGVKTCEAIEHPEWLAECAFLVPPAPSTAPTNTTDAGGDAATD